MRWRLVGRGRKRSRSSTRPQGPPGAWLTERRANAFHEKRGRDWKMTARGAPRGGALPCSKRALCRTGRFAACKRGAGRSEGAPPGAPLPRVSRGEYEEGAPRAVKKNTGADTPADKTCVWRASHASLHRARAARRKKRFATAMRQRKHRRQKRAQKVNT